MKKEDKVWVNETSLNGKELKHEWQGVIVEVNGDKVKIRDDKPGSLYRGQIFDRFIWNLEPRN